MVRINYTFTAQSRDSNAQVGPTLHPPLNITANRGPINWTVTLVCDFKKSSVRMASHLLAISPMACPFSSPLQTRLAMDGRRVRCIVVMALIRRV